MTQHNADLRQPAHTLGTGPLEPERALTLQLTYKGVIERLADAAGPEGYPRIRDLPELSHAELSAVIKHHPGILMDAMAEYDHELRALVPATLEQAGTPVDRYRLIGLHIVAALRRYVLPLVLRDVQERCEHNHALDALEDRMSHREVLTPDQELATELGLGRLS